MLTQINTFGNTEYKVSDLKLFCSTGIEKQLKDCAVVRIEENDVLAEAKDLYVVLKGRLTDSANIILPGETVGECSTFCNRQNKATALQETDLLVVEEPLFQTLIDSSSKLTRNLLKLLSSRVTATGAQLRRRQKFGNYYQQLSMVDSLTELHNRAWLNDYLHTMMVASNHHNTSLSLIMIDLDHFKSFNDTYGHIVGDKALRTSAHVIKSCVRPADYAVRFGGEEMMIVLPEAPPEVVLSVAERIRTQLSRTEVLGTTPFPHITASFGIAHLQASQDETSFIAAADAALYRAKKLGRNRVSL